MPKGTLTKPCGFRLNTKFKQAYYCWLAWATGRFDLKAMLAPIETSMETKRDAKKETKRDTKRETNRETKNETKKGYQKGHETNMTGSELNFAFKPYLSGRHGRLVALTSKLCGPKKETTREAKKDIKKDTNK